MASQTYPIKLPHPQVAQLKSDERLLRADNSADFTTRPVQRDRLAVQQVMFTFTFSEAAVFRIWWKDDLTYGAAWFSSGWPHPSGVQDAVRRFVGMPRWSLLANYGWQVSATLEVRGQGMLPQSADVPFFADASLYVSGRTSIVDATGRNAVTPFGVSNVPGPGGLGWMQFDSGSTGVSVNPSFPADFDFSAGEFTFDCWVWVDPSIGSPWCPMGCEGWEWAVITGSNIALNSTFSSSGQWAASRTVPASTAVHMAFAYDGTTMRCFLNGVGSVAPKQGSPATTYASSLWIGKNGASGFPYPFKGYIREVRVVRRCLWTRNFTPYPGPYQTS